MPTKKKQVIFQPQEGSQTRFHSTHADVCIFGGSAGGGKSFSLLMEPLRYSGNPNFGAVLFRASYQQIYNQGALFDQSKKLYPNFGAKFVASKNNWTFLSGAKVNFRSLSHPDDVLGHQGTEYDLIEFDELTHQRESSFWYMLSRNRSVSGVKPYMRCSTNPDDPDGWITNLISWWIGDDGFIIPERDGVVRWFIRLEDELIWADDPDDLAKYKIPPKSFTFIRSTVYDNKKLLEINPEYIASLYALPYIDRMRLLEGNWKIKATAGAVINRGWLKTIDDEELQFDTLRPPSEVEIVRFWDLAATAVDLKKPPSKSKRDGACYTVGVKMALRRGRYFILDVIRVRKSPAEVNKLMLETAENDGLYCKVRWEKEPGSSGIRDTDTLKTMLYRFDCNGVSPEGDKLVRVKPFAARMEQGLVYAVRASWNDRWIDELHGIPDENPYWDQVDATSGAFNFLWDGLNTPVPQNFATYMTTGR